jgi:hypothetical protein
MCWSINGWLTQYSPQALSLSKSQGTYGAIHAQTFCIVFFGTPHKGSESANLAKVIARIVSVCKTVEVRNLDVLKKDSNALFDLEQSFMLVLRDSNINILSLFELQKTKIHLFRNILVCSTTSSFRDFCLVSNIAHKSACADDRL